jgi:hypothetical protein
MPAEILDLDVHGESCDATVACPLCGEPNLIAGIPYGPFLLWQGGLGFIQQMLPMLTDGQREGLLSGCHEDCFNECFPEEDDDEET